LTDHPTELTIEVLEQIKTAGLSHDDLFDFFQEHVGSEVLDGWLLKQLQPITSNAQFMLRLARMAHSYWEGTDGRQHLLFGVPLVVESSPSALSWKELQMALQDGFRFALKELDAKVELCARPVETRVLHLVGVSTLGDWVEQLQLGEDPAKGYYELQPIGPCVWVGSVSVPNAHRAELESLLFKVNKTWSDMVTALCKRAEAIGEEQGAKFRCFPATAFWNSLSLSRLAHARVGTDKFRAQRALFKGSFLGGKYRLAGVQGVVFEADFPEETAQDLGPLL
jgi:hypothetical protein